MYKISLNQIEKTIRKENYILLLLILFLSARSNVISLHYMTLLSVFIFAIILFVKRGYELHMTIVLFTIIYLSSLAVYYLTFGWLDILLSIRMLLIFILSYMAIRILDEDFSSLYEKIIYVLAIISLILFPFQILFYKELYKIVNVISYVIPNFGSREDISFANIFVFSINGDGASRNSGFTWEPKGYGNFLIIAIVINLVQNKFKINRKLIVLTLATLTTLSTVAYLILFFLIPIFVMLNVSKSYFLLFIPFFVISILLTLQLPFMQKKVEREWIGRYEYKALLEDSRFVNIERSLGRMPSMIVDFNDFLKNPIFGYGVQKNERTQSIYVHLVRTNGLSDWLADFGIVGLLFLLFAHYIGFKKYLLHNNLRGQTILVVIVLFIYFATTVTTHPFWIMLQFMFVSNYLREGENYQEDRTLTIQRQLCT